MPARSPTPLNNGAESAPEADARTQALCQLLLAALPFLVYGRFIALGDELANADVFLAYRPAHTWLADGLRQGRVPVWTSAILGGFPLAFSEYGWFSPLNWLALFIGGGHAGYYLAVALYVALAGVTTYHLARHWGATPPAALLAGLVYSESLYVVGGAPLLNQGAAYFVLPLLLLAVDLAFGRAPIGPPLAAVAVALLLLGSHPQLAVLCALPAAGLALLLAMRSRSMWPLATLGMAAALGAAVSAVRFLPTLPLVAASTRSTGLDQNASAIGSVSPLALAAGLLLPSISIPRYLNAQWSAYLGPLAVALALVGLRGIGWRPSIRDRVPAAVWFLLAIATLGLVLALGSNTPVYWLIARSPLLTYFREPSRFLLWTVLAVALLAARGADLSTSRRPNTVRWRRSLLLASLLPALATAGSAAALRVFAPPLKLDLQLRALTGARARDYPVSHYLGAAEATWTQLTASFDVTHVAVLAPLAAIVATSWWWGWGRTRVPSHARWRAVAVVSVPLLAYGQARLPAIPAAVVNETPVALQRGDQAAGDARRVYSWLPLALDNEARLDAAAAGTNPDVASYRTLRRLMAPNFALDTGTAQLDGYENLMSREQALLLTAIGSERAATGGPLSISGIAIGERRQRVGERWPLLFAAGTDRVLSADPFLPLSWPAAVRFEPAVVSPQKGLPPVVAFDVTRPVPRAYVTTDWKVVATPEEAVSALLAPSNRTDSLARTVVTDPEGRARPIARSGAPVGGDERATIVRDGERRVEIETNSGSEGLLVLLDAFAPGWSATVTGAPVPIFHANVAFRGVLVPAGQQRVVFTYTPSGWPLALGVTSASAAIALGWLAWALLALRASEARYTGEPALSLT